MEQYITRFELADGSAVAGTLLSVDSRTEPPGIARVTVRVDSDTLGAVSFDASHVTAMEAGKARLENPDRETLLKAILDRLAEMRKGPMAGYQDYPGSPGVHAEFPGDTRESDRKLMAMYLRRVQLMESVLGNHGGKVVCPALFHLACGDIIEEFRQAGFCMMEGVDVLAAVQCFVAKKLSEILPDADWLQVYLDFNHRDELGKLIGEYA